jgi:hypothetical protein
LGGTVAQKSAFVQPTHHLTPHLFQKIAKICMLAKHRIPHIFSKPPPTATGSTTPNRRCSRSPPPATKLRQKKKKKNSGDFSTHPTSKIDFNA